MRNIAPTPGRPDPYADKMPHCTAYPPEAPLAQLLPDLVGACLAVDGPQQVPDRYAVVVDCLHTSRNIDLARLHHPCRPIIAVVSRPDADEVLTALAANAEGIVCLSDPPVIWRDCVNVVLGGGRWFDGPGVEVQMENKFTRYEISRGTQHPGDVTMRTRTYVRQNVPDKLYR